MSPKLQQELVKWKAATTLRREVHGYRQETEAYGACRVGAAGALVDGVTRRDDKSKVYHIQ
jgi:hypothetical protein